VINSRLAAEQHLLHFIAFSVYVVLNKHWSNIFRSTALYIVGPTVARDNTVVLCSPGRERLVFNSAGPVNRWCRWQSSLRSEATALSSVCVYFDELATFHEIEIRCHFKAFIDSLSAISNAVSIRNLIPKRQYPHNADYMTTIKDA
jgi:hypothetical protein